MEMSNTAPISVITPTNSLQFFQRAYRSLQRQTLPRWEWVVVLNGNAVQMHQLFRDWVQGDPRVVFVLFQGAANPDGGYNVGALKKEACLRASAPYVVEFDHDDELAVTCLADVLKAFKGTDAVFVFSEEVRSEADGKPKKYGEQYGWRYKMGSFCGEKEERHEIAEQPLVVPQNISRIWYAPDHVRAWRADAYKAVGGHNPDLKVCDDLELMCKLFRYSGGKFHMIPKVLYKYQIHGDNTWLKNTQLIEDLMWKIHDERIEEMTQAFYGKEQCFDLGGGINSPAGWTSVDVHSAEVKADLNRKWPWKSNSVSAFRAHDILEHLKKPAHVMQEAYRCLKHGGLFLIEVPSTDGRGAFQDPSHVSFWNTNSFWYYTKAQTQRYVKHLAVNCRFQVVRMLNYYPSDWHRAHNILYSKAHLAAVKDGPRLHGALEI